MGRDSGVSIGSVFLKIIVMLFFFTFLVSLTHSSKANDAGPNPNWIGYFIEVILSTFFTHTFLFFSGNRDVLRSSYLQKY